MIKFKPWVYPTKTKYKPHGRVMSCVDCGYAPDGPMIAHELWLSVVCKPAEDPARLLLCFECIEHRLGRFIALSDLVNCPMNGPLLSVLERHSSSSSSIIDCTVGKRQ